MGRKRKQNDLDSENEIRRKIRKWERKLLKKRSHRVIYSSDEHSNNGLDDVDMNRYETENYVSSPSPPPLPSSPPPPHSPLPIPSPPHAVAAAASPPPSDPPQLPPPEKEIGPEETELDDDILQLLGDAPKSETPMGPSIHKDVANRWQETLAKGLTKEIKDKLFCDYLIPGNCDLLIAPALNPEAKAALTDTLVKRDNFLMQKQKQLAVALSALASATTLILANETSKQKLLKPLSDACRILCDSHFMETKTRRNLVISATNLQLKGTLIESVRDRSWLFGENISEKLKAAKTIQKSGEDLRNLPKTVARSNNYQAKSIRGRLNYKPQHRKTDNKPTTSTDSARGRQQARAPQRSAARAPRRSPPPRGSYRR